MRRYSVKGWVSELRHNLYLCGEQISPSPSKQSLLITPEL